MNQIVHFLPTVSFIRSLRSGRYRWKASQRGSFLAVICLGRVVGCSDPDWTSDRFQNLPNEVSIDSPLAMGSSSSQTRLASFVERPRHRVQWTFGGFDTSTGLNASSNNRSTAERPLDDAILLVQAPALPELSPNPQDQAKVQAQFEDQAGPSASDLGPVELIQTPPARPEVKAELIPTPQGIPEGSELRSQPQLSPVARIAADVEGSNSTLKVQKPSATEMAASGEEIPQRPALIDPTTELGLVGSPNGPEDFRKWPAPDAVLFVTGDQHGYIEPCGCTGLDKQKGGVQSRA